MPDQREIYNQHAEQYERIVLREGYAVTDIELLAEQIPRFHALVNGRAS